MKILQLILILFISNSWATTYYVNATTGIDTNNGTSIATALKTIQKGADYANAGDTVLVMDGIYINLPNSGEVVFLNKSGNTNNWIVFKNYPNQHPKIKFNTWAAFSIQPGTAYVEINGFEIQGNNDNVTLANALNQFHSCNNPGTDADPYQSEFNGNGIAADGRYSSPGYAKPHHIRILNNIVYDCGGGGISAIQSDYVTIKNNLVYDNSWYTIFGSSGISIYQSWSSDNNTTDYKNIVDGNICHNNRLFVPWFSGCVISDGNGIIIDDSKNTQNGSTLGVYNGKTLVQNNVVYLNGGSGIHAYESKHITIVNNTAYKNSESVELTDGQIFANTCDDVKIINNILYAGSDGKINSNYNNTNLVYENNLHFNNSGTINLTSQTCIVGNPNFVNESSFNFHLQNNSPAINTGNTTTFSGLDFDGNTRTNPDIGAFEYNNALGTNDFELLSTKIKIYPNPTSENLIYETSENIDKIVLVNMLGQQTELKFRDNKIDVSEFSTGIYKLVFYKNNSIFENHSLIKN